MCACVCFNLKVIYVLKAFKIMKTVNCIFRTKKKILIQNTIIIAL